MARKIILSADGTWNKPDQRDRGVVSPTNVVKLARSVAEADAAGNPQVAVYDSGVGTGGWLDKVLGGAFGHGLSKNILDLYGALVERYQPGDEIFLFGFSRGAYTARSLAGLIRNCGILKPEHSGRMREAYGLYRRKDEDSKPDGRDALLFRDRYSRTTRIRFIGVWDTVGALGIPLSGLRLVNALVNVRFHDVRLSTHVDHAYQALALDEKRGPFKPAVWEQQENAAGQVLEQAWFAGVHSNVGGGYRDAGLSDAALAWMLEKARSCGLAFDPEMLASFSIRPDSAGALMDSRTLAYKLLPSYERMPGKGPRGHERAHPSIFQRMAKVPLYRPRNLLAALERAEINLG
jgi:uncharacterized protein (DUF2235 family)